MNGAKSVRPRAGSADDAEDAVPAGEVCDLAEGGGLCGLDDGRAEARGVGSGSRVSSSSSLRLVELTEK